METIPTLVEFQPLHDRERVFADRAHAGRLLAGMLAVRRMAGEVDALYCANVRGRRRFAVADAYQSWSDVEEDTALRLLQREREQAQAAATGT